MHEKANSKSQKQETGSKKHNDCRLIFTNNLFVTFYTHVF